MSEAHTLRKACGADARRRLNHDKSRSFGAHLKCGTFNHKSEVHGVWGKRCRLDLSRCGGESANRTLSRLATGLSLPARKARRYSSLDAPSHTAHDTLMHGYFSSMPSKEGRKRRGDFPHRGSRRGHALSNGAVCWHSNMHGSHAVEEGRY